MLKLVSKHHPFIKGIVDSLIIISVWMISYALRFKYFGTDPQQLSGLFLNLSLALSFITLYYFKKNDLYKGQHFTNIYSEIVNIVKANLFSVTTFVVLLYFVAQDKVSRIVIANYSILSTFLLIIFRVGIRRMIRLAQTEGYGLKKVLLVGSGPQLVHYLEEFFRLNNTGIQILGWVESEGSHKKFNLRDFGNDLEAAKKELKPEILIVGHPSEKMNKVEKILKDNSNELLQVQLIPDLTYSLIGHKIEEFFGIPVLNINTPDLKTFDLILKRSLDMIGSFLGLLALFPFLIIIGVLVKLTSRGPIFFKQERVGLNGKRFQMWKFRTMKVLKESDTEYGWTVKDDPRKTPFGSLLRKTSLDELPQLWNVLVGDMSLVGPRPEQTFFVEKFKDDIPSYMLRHRMKAGITGWAQVNGWRGDTSLVRRVEHDIYYIKNWSFWLDIKILFLTFWKGLINKNAY